MDNNFENYGVTRTLWKSAGDFFRKTCLHCKICRIVNREIDKNVALQNRMKQEHCCCESGFTGSLGKMEEAEKEDDNFFISIGILADTDMRFFR